MARKRNFGYSWEVISFRNQKQRDFNYIAGLLNDPNISKYFAEPSVKDSQKCWHTEAEGKEGFNDFTSKPVKRN